MDFNDYFCSYLKGDSSYKFDNEQNTHVYEIKAAGMSKEDVSVEHLNGWLHITIGDKSYRASVSSDADINKIKAVMKYGLLTIILPSKDKVKIEVDGD